MKNFGILLLVSLFSSLFSIFLYRKFDGPRVTWGTEEGSARYTGLVEKLVNSRSQSSFRSSAPTDFTVAAEISTPAVVNIRALAMSDENGWSGSMTGSSGSGVIISPDGFILTNNHVVAKSHDIKVTLADRREYRAKLLGTDPGTDVALLKIDEGSLPFLVFGNSDSLKVGEWVLAVGNPFNLESTVTAGIVSAKGRNINILGGGSSIESFIQTDAAVNPGNSGGALVNTEGELVGINTAIITESGSYEGYSFAVPSNLAQKVVRDLREFGRVERAFLGVGIQDLDGDLVQEVGLSSMEGVYVNRVSLNGGADDAGLRERDVILSINNTKIRSTPELQELIGRFRPGDKVSVDYWRNGRKNHSQVMLKDSHNLTAVGTMRGDELDESLGLSLRELKKEERSRLKISGCVVSSIRRESVAYQTNMQPGFVVVSVNGNSVTNVQEAMEAMQNARNQVILDGYYEGEPDLYSYRFRKR